MCSDQLRTERGCGCTGKKSEEAHTRVALTRLKSGAHSGGVPRWRGGPQCSQQRTRVGSQQRPMGAGGGEVGLSDGGPSPPVWGAVAAASERVKWQVSVGGAFWHLSGLRGQGWRGGNYSGAPAGEGVAGSRREERVTALGGRRRCRSQGGARCLGAIQAETLDRRQDRGHLGLCGGAAAPLG